jgi:lysophospholipid acyltransferase
LGEGGNLLVQLWSPDSARPCPASFGAALSAFLRALLCMGIYLFVVPRFPLAKFASLEYQKWGFWHRLKYMYLTAFSARWKYYFVWSISEVAVIISGLGFSGWTAPDGDKVVKAKWTRAKNVDILKVEFAKSGVELPMYWNISVSTWLRHCMLSLQALIIVLFRQQQFHLYVKFRIRGFARSLRRAMKCPV